MEMNLRKPGSLTDWLRVYKLYVQAFPKAERKPFGMIRKKYREGATDVWCVERDGSFCGIAITINGEELVLLDYFAMERSCRGQRIGSEALVMLMERYFPRGLFVEIESTLDEVPDLQDRLRRKQFYLNNGMQELCVTAKLFGVDMELLGSGCSLTFHQYRNFYRDNYNSWAAEHITQ